ncbi:MAG TPA: NAD(P)/FAD-dependent oxidoreductase [Pseudolabrys sp.]|nr:NAD(P)/FAD-dependent oxidoreductase [Pseudolabrys sp.]
MQILVIGAGVIGLSVARAAARRGHEVAVAEAASAIGTGISSRNSEVIHGGMYYPTGTLRARHCVAGRRMLYEFCASHGVPHRKCGKLVVATNAAELGKIEAIFAQGKINDVEGLELIGGNAARALEPELACIGALVSPETGVIDGHAYMLALRGDLENAGGAIALNTPVQGAARKGGRWAVAFGGSDAGEFEFDAIVNCAGLHAQSVARAMPDYPPTRVPRLVLAKGNYFSCAGKPAFSRLIYPTPIVGGLGVHVTLDLAGRMRFGPDVEWVAREHYDVDPARAASFYARIRTYWPGLPDGALAPDYSGIRPKLTGPSEPQADFLIDAPAQHGLPGLVQMFGIESPGLTSSLSLAEEVADYLES